MITVTINDPELERVYHSFNGNDEKFGEYLSLQTSANNSEYGLDAKMVEKAYDEADSDENNDLNHDEVWANLFAKYEKN